MFQVKTYIRFPDFQSKSELLMTEKVLPFTDEVIVVLVHKCSQQLQLLALHLEMLGNILGLLKGIGYLHKTGDLIGDHLTRRLLRRILVLDAPCRSTEETVGFRCVPLFLKELQTLMSEFPLLCVNSL